MKMRRPRFIESFTNELKNTHVSLERECSDLGANVSVYKPLYGDMDENLPLPDITLYPSLIEFRDAIKEETKYEN